MRKVSPLDGKVMVYDAGPPVKVIVTTDWRRKMAGVSGVATERVAKAESRMAEAYMFAAWRWVLGGVWVYVRLAWN